jgi:hypothetical protein
MQMGAGIMDYLRNFKKTYSGPSETPNPLTDYEKTPNPLTDYEKTPNPLTKYEETILKKYSVNPWDYIESPDVTITDGSVDKLFFCSTSGTTHGIVKIFMQDNNEIKVQIVKGISGVGQIRTIKKSGNFKFYEPIIKESQNGGKRKRKSRRNRKSRQNQRKTSRQSRRR